MHALENLTLTAGALCLAALTVGFGLMLIEHWFVLTPQERTSHLRTTPLFKTGALLVVIGMALTVVGFFLETVMGIGWEVQHWSDPLPAHPPHISRDDPNYAVYHEDDF